MGTPIGSIEILGTRTRPEVIRKFLDSREGREFDAELWERDLRRLKNLDYFYDIRAQALEENGRVHLRLHLRNKLSSIPVFKYKRGGNATLVTAGFYEVNLGNRLLELGSQYERLNDKGGVVLWFRHPYLGSRRNHFGAEIYAHTLDLPLLTLRGEEEAFFENRELRANARLEREVSERVRVGLEAGVYRNDLVPDGSSPRSVQANALFAAGSPLRSGLTVSLTPRLVLGRLDRDRHYVSGQELFLQGELAQRWLGSQFAFAKGLAGLNGGWRPRERLNLVYQARLGSKTGREFQHKFYLGGLDTVRGFLDGQFRGEHMWLANAELRPTLLERPGWVLQGNLFADLGKTWDARSFGLDGFQEPFLSYGAGVRVVLPSVYRALLRLDLARTQQPVRRFGFNLGLQQFF